MIRVCNYCLKIMGEKEPLEDTRIRHGICKKCLVKWFPALVGKKVERHADFNMERHTACG